MDSSLQFISTVNMTREEWLSYRMTGLGASEIGSILGLNPYKSSIELFYEKVGASVRFSIENMAMFIGKEQEDFIAKMWTYWGGSEESMIANWRNNLQVRRCQKVNAYVRNPEFPHLFVSLDRKINKHENNEEGALELKTLGGFEANKWETGLPVSHLIQLQVQLMVCKFDYGELAVLQDGRNLMVYPFVTLPDVQATIAARTKEFWERVLQARIYFNTKFEAERNFNNRLANEMSEKLALLEPPPDGSDSYTAYLSAKFKNKTVGLKNGSLLDLEAAKLQKSLTEQIKALELVKNEQENVLKSSIAERDGLDFGAEGKVLWKKNKNDVRLFRNLVKL